jgi:hypothetical protein
MFKGGGRKSTKDRQERKGDQGNSNTGLREAQEKKKWIPRPLRMTDGVAVFGGILQFFLLFLVPVNGMDNSLVPVGGGGWLTIGLAFAGYVV